MTSTEIRTLLVEMHVSLGNIQPVFNRKSYPEEFEKYFRKWEPVIAEMEKACEQSQDPETFLDSIADAQAAAAKERHSALTRRKTEMVLLQDQLALVAFVFPTLRYYKSAFADQLCDAVCAAWNTAFHTTLRTATYEEINAGFTRKYCYITTAVCETLHKPDDCRELTMLRTYRDEYMDSIESGQELIARYYDIAPTIVNRINRSGCAEQIYSSIYKEYIVPCLDSIEQGNNEECLVRYRKMVTDLERRYMYSC